METYAVRWNRVLYHAWRDGERVADVIQRSPYDETAEWVAMERNRDPKTEGAKPYLSTPAFPTRDEALDAFAPGASDDIRGNVEE